MKLKPSLLFNNFLHENGCGVTKFVLYFVAMGFLRGLPKAVWIFLFQTKVNAFCAVFLIGYDVKPRVKETQRSHTPIYEI